MADAIWKFHLEADGRMGDYVATMPAGAGIVPFGGVIKPWSITKSFGSFLARYEALTNG